MLVVLVIFVLFDALASFHHKVLPSATNLWRLRKTKVCLNDHKNMLSQRRLFLLNNDDTEKETSSSSPSQDLAIYERASDKSTSYANQMSFNNNNHHHHHNNRYRNRVLLSESTRLHIQHNLDQLLELCQFHLPISIIGNSSYSSSHESITHIKSCCRLSIPGITEFNIYSTDKTKYSAAAFKEVSNESFERNRFLLDDANNLEPTASYSILFTCPIDIDSTIYSGTNSGATSSTDSTYYTTSDSVNEEGVNRSWGQIQLYGISQSSFPSDTKDRVRARAPLNADDNDSDSDNGNDSVNKYIKQLCTYTARNVALLLKTEILSNQLQNLAVCLYICMLVFLFYSISSQTYLYSYSYSYLCSKMQLTPVMKSKTLFLPPERWFSYFLSGEYGILIFILFIFILFIFLIWYDRFCCCSKLDR